MNTSWWMYVVRCRDGSLYCGVTTDTVRWLWEHSGQLRGGARYTRSRRPVRMVWTESHPGRSEACRAEAAFKKLSRPAKLDYMKNRNRVATGSSGC
jgi:putative endonuclease